jgi:hypothetical protein
MGRTDGLAPAGAVLYVSKASGLSPVEGADREPGDVAAGAAPPLGEQVRTRSVVVGVQGPGDGLVGGTLVPDGGDQGQQPLDDPRGESYEWTGHPPRSLLDHGGSPRIALWSLGAKTAPAIPSVDVWVPPARPIA